MCCFDLDSPKFLLHSFFLGIAFQGYLDVDTCFWRLSRLSSVWLLLNLATRRAHLSCGWAPKSLADCCSGPEIQQCLALCLGRITSKSVACRPQAKHAQHAAATIALGLKGKGKRQQPRCIVHVVAISRTDVNHKHPPSMSKMCVPGTILIKYKHFTIRAFPMEKNSVVYVVRHNNHAGTVKPNSLTDVSRETPEFPNM